MKKITILFSLFALCAACQEEYMTHQDEARLQFGPTPDKIYTTQSEWEDTLKTMSFLKLPQNQMEDTIYFDLYSIGAVSGVDRHFELEQIFIDGADNAIPGLHFRPFEDEAMLKQYVMPAGESHVRVPVVVFREKSLEEKAYVLKFKISENANFLSGDPYKCWRKLIMADILMRPKKWNDNLFGPYSQVKHRFMMLVTGLEWDDEFLDSFMKEVDLQFYWQSRLQKELYNYNNNPENEDTPLRDENGYEIKFNK